ncbi:MAG: (Fe-S)-binding protein [Gemmobacter sp.]|jgi:Fe-S oxidoreductase|nr:(Fe-S)-binding protein [Gemmobacter sp.]
MTATALASLIVLCTAILMIALRTVQLIARWRVGRPGGAGWAKGLAAMPRRYLRDVHHVVARERSSARMHAALAGGLLAGCSLAAALAIWPGRGLGGLLALSVAMAGYGVWLQYRRRHPRPARLSGGAWSRLTPALGAVLVFLAGMALSAFIPQPGGVVWPLALVGAAGLLWLGWSVQGGPMRHAVAGSLHLAQHPRPARFKAPHPAGHADSALLPVNLSAPAFGVQRAADFAWNRLVSFDACVQCGRCEAACPAFAAGLPLNPKALIADLSFALDRPGARRVYAGSPHPGRAPLLQAPGPHNPIVADGEGALVAPDTLWSCTTCRACVEECPMLIEHVDAVIDLRRAETMEKGAVPPKAAEVLDNLAMTDTQGGAAPAARLDGLVDLNLPLAGSAPVDVLLWLGESAYDRRNQRQIRAFVALLRKAGVDFAVIRGECDTGDLARRLGDEAGFQRLARANIASLSALDFRRIVTMDPHVLHVLRREYPAFGGRWQVEHHTTLLAALLAGGRLSPGPVKGRVTYHDPCYLGRYNGEYEAPRAILAAVGVDLAEMEHAGRRSRCCGGGGGAALTDVVGERRIPDMRMDQARATGAGLVVAACPFCTQMLEGVTGDRPEVTDIAELLLAAVEGAG